MSTSIFTRFFRKKRALEFFAWQVELTTRCPLRCRMCIRDSCEDWHTADMPMDEFKRLAPYFRHVRNVVLEGWGESLLHRDLVEAVRTVRGAGSRPGFVTSGWGLNREYITDLIKGGLHFIGFSIAGATPGTHDGIRVNSHLPDVLQAIQDFNKIKADLKVDNPSLHIVYLVLRDNIAEIPPLLDLAKRLGIEFVVLINLAHVTNEWQNSQKVFTCGKDEGRSILEEARNKAEELGIVLKEPCLFPRPMAVCEEDPVGNLFISVDGRVAPCVYLHPPTASRIKRIYCDKELSIERLSFGNIFEQPLESIWNSEGYAAFRESYNLRKKKFDALCSLASSVALNPERMKKSGEAVLPSPPEPCRTCHRLLGI